MAVLPLQGIRIVDMTVVLAGPYAAMFLADMGAEVIRVESTQHFLPGTRGQFARPTKEMQAGRSARLPNGEPGPRPWNQVPTFNSMARNKLSMTVDITKPEGMDILKRLVRISDVFLENYVPSVMDKLGITYEMLKQEKPDIIFAKLSGYGDTGPYRDYRAFAMTVDPITGHSSLRGYRDQDPSTLTEGILADAAEGILGVVAIMAALHHRNRTGKGQVLDLCLSESGMSYLPQAFMDYYSEGCGDCPPSGNPSNAGLPGPGAGVYRVHRQPPCRQWLPAGGHAVDKAVEWFVAMVHTWKEKTL